MAKASKPTTAITNFKTAFCEHFGCSQETFLAEFFWKSLDPGWRPIAFGLRRVWPGYFASDLRYLERIGEATGWHEVNSLANGIRSEETLNRGLLRKFLHFRISGSRVMNVREEISKARRDATA